MPSKEAIAALAHIQHKNLAAGGEGVRVRGEIVRKPIAEPWNRVIGQAIERAIVLAKLSKQDVAYQMGYADQSALARWISGVETAQLPKLFAIEGLRQPLVIALAEIAACEIETVVRIRRHA